MKAKHATAYGLHAMMYMVRHITQLPLTAKAIARAEGIPPAYLSRILRRFVKAGLLKTAANARDGYVFARPPEQITLLDVFEVMEDTLFSDECLMQHGPCGVGPGQCALYGTWHQAMQRVKDHLAQTTLDAAAWGHPEHTFHQTPADAG